MGKTVTIPNTDFDDPQNDRVRTGCCLFVHFKVSGKIQLKLLSGSIAIPTFPFHVDKKEYGPFKTPIFDAAVGWHLVPDNGSNELDGILTIDGKGDCSEFKPSHTCEDDHLAQPKPRNEK